MATIREVVQAFASRDGVQSVLFVGRDGLPIDSMCAPGVDGEGLAALLPSIINASSRLGEAGGQGEFSSTVTQLERGFVIVAALSREVILAIFLADETNVGSLLFEVRRYRPALASLL